MAAALGLRNSYAGQSESGRRVLVSILLLGGNDSNNLLVPLDARGYSAYSAVRGELALPAESLIEIPSTRLQNSYGLARETADLSTLYQQGVLALVANTGDISRPMTKAIYLNARESLPRDNFSHSAASKMQFLGGAFPVPRWSCGLFKQEAQDLDNQAFRFSNGVATASVSGSWITGARLDNPSLTDAIQAVDVRTSFPRTGIGQELLHAVKLAQAGANLGLGNQLISCVMSGWDTHRDELARNSNLYTDLSQSLSAFYQATVELGIARDVTAFTWSEFGRAMTPNARHGTEHGWGGHQVVVGGSVRGGEIYGAFPSFEVGGADDAFGNGSWIPSTSTAQFAATLANWFGLSDAEQHSMAPDLRNFAVTDLGFLS